VLLVVVEPVVVPVLPVLVVEPVPVVEPVDVVPLPVVEPVDVVPLPVVEPVDVVPVLLVPVVVLPVPEVVLLVLVAHPLNVAVAPKSCKIFVTYCSIVEQGLVAVPVEEVEPVPLVVELPELVDVEPELPPAV
jgi:hypothetical protein